MARRALVTVEANAQSGGIGLGYQIGLRWIGVSAEGQIAAIIADAFKLNGALEAFVKHELLNRGEVGQRSPSSRRTGAYSRIFGLLLCVGGGGDRKEHECNAHTYGPILSNMLHWLSSSEICACSDGGVERRDTSRIVRRECSGLADCINRRRRIST